MRKKCDKCGSKIINNQCFCGTWVELKYSPREICDRCNSKIINYECFCGFWKDSKYSAKVDFGIRFKGIKDVNDFIQLMNYILLWAEENCSDVFSGDHQPSGMGYVIFKGDYKKVMKVKEYVKSLDKEEK